MRFLATPPRQRVALADYIARETSDPYAIWYCNENKNATDDFDMRLYRIGKSNKTYAVNQPLPADAPKAVWFKDLGEMVAHSNLPQHQENLFLSFVPVRSGQAAIRCQTRTVLIFTSGVSLFIAPPVIIFISAILTI